MADQPPATKGVTPDWLVRGVLTKVGDIFDRLTGRGWKPSSSLATSELVERLKALLDSEARDETPGCKFVPNNIKLRMQWDKFSTDSDESMRKLETELLAAAVDHINDKRYFTHAPLAVEVKPDYFTPGVRLMVSFDRFADEEHEAGVDLNVPGATTLNLDESIPPHSSELTFVASYSVDGDLKRKTLNIAKGVRLSVGRTKENDLFINDPSVSKIHASLAVDEHGNLIVADTGSTNGTFVNGQRIAYGKAVFVADNSSVKFGGIDVLFRAEHIRRPSDDLALAVERDVPATDKVDHEPRPVSETLDSDEPAPTQASVPVSVPAPTEPSIDLAAVPKTTEGDQV